MDKLDIQGLLIAWLELFLCCGQEWSLTVHYHYLFHFIPMKKKVFPLGYPCEYNARSHLCLGMLISFGLWQESPSLTQNVICMVVLSPKVNTDGREG